MTAMLSDLRYGARLFLRRPGFFLLIVLILGLGIGANTAIFGLVKQVLLRPLPYEDASRLVRVSGTNSRGKGPLSYPDFLDLRERNRVFSDIALIDRYDPILTGEGEPTPLVGVRASPAYLSVLGVEPALGRFFLPEEEEYGQHRVAVLSHALWQSAFAGDPGVIDREITLWGTYTYTVVGVLPPDFEDAEAYYAVRPQIWRPLAVHPEQFFRDGRSYDGVVTRLAPGVTLSQAQDDLERIARELREEHPEENFEQGLVVEGLLEATVGEVRPALLALSVAVGLVLLIACANVANMLLARAADRQRELAVRASLGASTARLVRQLLAESLLLTAAAGVFALALAAWTSDLLVALAAEHLPRFETLPIDGGLLAFTALLCLGTALVCALAPAFQSARGRLLPGLREYPGSPGGARKRLQSALAVAEVGLALALLIAAGLLVRSLAKLLAVDPGFDPRGVVALTAEVEAEQLPQLLERVRALPGVEHAGATSMLPLVDNYSCDGFIVDARPAPPGQEDCAEIRFISSGYFEAMGIPLVRGRLFTDRDREGSPPVALVNAAMAARFWPGEDPVGQRLTKAGGERISREIVGVVGSVRHFGLDRDETPQYFFPQAQYEFSFAQTLVVKAGIDPAALVTGVKEEIRAAAPHAAISSLTLHEVVRSSVAEPSFRALLIGLFALLAGLLAAVGVYGVMAYTVHQRRREMGVRMALGADRSALLRQVLADGMRLAGLGILCGLAVAAALGRLLRSFLFQVSGLDLTTFAAMSALLVAVALLACYLPAWRASRVDPIAALRHE